MHRVIIESPYAGDVERNVTYARRCVRDSLVRGEAPIASHLLYTQLDILDDNIPADRMLGMAAGLAWAEVAKCMVIYQDYGVSSGMTNAIDYAARIDLRVEFRSIGENP